MFCKYCGKQLDANSNFCSGCGNQIQTELRRTIPDTNSHVLTASPDPYCPEPTPSPDPYHPAPKSIQIPPSPNPDAQLTKGEHTIATLKQSYFGSVTEGRGTQKNYIQLTNKRLYIKCRVAINANVKNIGNLKFETVDRVIPLKHVTGAEIFVLSMTMMKIIAATLSFLSLMFFIRSGDSRGDTQSIYIMVGIISAFIAIILIIRIAKGEEKILTIFHMGSSFSVLVRWYSEAEINSFRNKLMQALED